MIQATMSLWWREVVRFARQRSRWIGALATPLLFWFLIGGGLGTSFRDPSGGEGGYLEFFFPGAILLSVLFTAIFSTISVIEDRNQGFLQGVLVAPAHRGSFVLAKVLGGALLGLVQGLLVLMFAPLAHVHLTLVGFVETIIILWLLAAALTALGFVFAWIIDSTQGYHSVMNLVFVPMWILSGAVFPTKPDTVMGFIANINPLSPGVQALREIFTGAESVTFCRAVVVTGGFFLVLFAFSLYLIERPARK